MLLAALAGGCSATWGRPFDPNLVGREYYLCCTTRFSPRFEAADSNYEYYMGGPHQYDAGPILPAGTRVTVVKVGSSGIVFRPAGGDTTFSIRFSYGRNEMSPSTYFANILRDSDPLDSVDHATPSILAAIRDGHLTDGMTKEQAVLARGYPPAHRTPSLQSNTWLYYSTPGAVDRVYFIDDRIHAITRGPAPQ